MKLALTTLIVAVATLLIFTISFSFQNSDKQVTLMPESMFKVSFDNEKISCVDPNGHKNEIKWKNIKILKIRTTDEGPLKPDVFWEFYENRTTPSLVFPGGATGEREILKALQSRLPGFDNKALINAMGCTDNKEFVLWQKQKN